MIDIIMKSLTPEQIKQLTCGFEDGTSQFIEIEDKKYIGVNVDNISYLHPIEKIGVWSYGDIKR